MNIVVILGCALKNCGGSDKMEGRVRKGLETCARVNAELLILSGGLTSPECGTTESDVMESMIPHDLRANLRVELEKKSRSTIENAIFTREILESQKLNAALYVSTSCYHMNRALRIFSIILPNTEVRAGYCFEWAYDNIKAEVQKYDREIEKLEQFDWRRKDYISFISQ